MSSMPRAPRGNPAVGWRSRRVCANHGTVHVETDPDAGHVIGRAVMLGAITGTNLPLAGWPRGRR